MKAQTAVHDVLEAHGLSRSDLGPPDDAGWGTRASCPLREAVANAGPMTEPVHFFFSFKGLRKIRRAKNAKNLGRLFVRSLPLGRRRSEVASRRRDAAAATKAI